MTKHVSGMRIWEERDSASHELIAIHTHHFAWGTERTIWMDGRPHPPDYALHTAMGFSTGKWEGDILTVFTTHLKEGRMKSPYRLAAAMFSILIPLSIAAQDRGTVPRSPKDSAPFDLAGYWVSIVSEDWRFRMFTPPKGDYPNVPLNPEGRKVADAWDPAKDQAAGEQCRPFGAAN